MTGVVTNPVHYPRQPTIADVLRHAADNCLRKQEYLSDDEEYTSRFSCDAVARASRDLCGEYTNWLPMDERIMKGLQNLGLDTGSLTAFDEFPPGEVRQGARHAWLYFAAMIAEEQGV